MRIFLLTLGAAMIGFAFGQGVDLNRNSQIRKPARFRDAVRSVRTSNQQRNARGLTLRSLKPKKRTVMDLYFEGLRQYHRGDLEGAANTLDQAFKINPTLPDVRNTLQRVKEEWSQINDKD